MQRLGFCLSTNLMFVLQLIPWVLYRVVLHSVVLCCVVVVLLWCLFQDVALTHPSQTFRII